jgi:hypothetical protein
MWTGPASEVFKTEFPFAIVRGVPFQSEYEGISYIDLFLNDPLYVMVDTDKAKAMLDALAAAEGDFEKAHALKLQNVESHKDQAREKLANWYRERDADRAARARPVVPVGAQEPAPPIRPPPRGGGK